MGVKGYRLGLNAKTLGITFLIALLVVGATALTARALERLHALVEQISQVEMENLMTSVRVVQQAESLISLGLMLYAAETQNERRRALVELTDRTVWIRHMTAEVSAVGNHAEMLQRVDEIQQQLDLNIRQLNHLVRDRINQRIDADGQEELRLLAAQNRELAGELSVLMGYFATQVRLQMTQQSQHLQQEIRLHQQNLVALALFILLFAVLAGAYFDLTVVRRILKMQRAVSKPVVSVQDFEQRGTDEIAQLSQTVRSYIERIQQQEAHMQCINQELSFLAEHDPLTGLANRRHFHAAARRLLRQSSLPLCVALCDIDHFKHVNDQKGHAVGDVALKYLAEQLADGLRETDVLARLGGEEFAAILPVQSLDDAERLFNKLRHSLEVNPLCLPDGETVQLTCSFGLALVESTPLALEASDDFAEAVLDAALLEADQALYRAKAQGRNCVCVAKTAIQAKVLVVSEGDQNE